MKEPRKLSRIVIKEEFVALTGDFKLAIVLNQMMYWQERRRDADLFIEEEKKRYQKWQRAIMMIMRYMFLTNGIKKV